MCVELPCGKPDTTHLDVFNVKELHPLPTTTGITIVGGWKNIQIRIEILISSRSS